MLSIILLSVTLLSGIMMNVIILSVALLSIVMMNVVAPQKGLESAFQMILKIIL
jgi:hypothetical protein